MYIYNIYICIHMYTYMYIPWYSPLCSPLYPHYLPRISLAPKILPPPRKPPAMCSNSSPAPAAEPPVAAPRPHLNPHVIHILGGQIQCQFWKVRRPVVEGILFIWWETQKFSADLPFLLSQAKKVNIAAQRLPRPAGAPAGACFWLTVGQSGAARQHRV